MATEAEVSNLLNQRAPGAHISLLPGQVTRPLGHLQQTAPVFQEKPVVIMVLASKNCFYLLNPTFADVVLPTSTISRFLAEGLAWAATAFL